MRATAVKTETSHKHEILLCCWFYTMFGNQFIVAMGYPAERAGLEATWRFSGNDRHDSKTTAYAITSVLVNVLWSFNYLLTEWHSFREFGIFQTQFDSVLRQHQPSCICAPTWNNSREHWHLTINQRPFPPSWSFCRRYVTTLSPLQADCMLCVHDIHISYLPLAHMLERVIHVSEDKHSLQSDCDLFMFFNTFMAA